MVGYQHLSIQSWFYDQALGMLLWRRVLDKDCQLISTAWYCIYLHLIRLHQETCIVEIFFEYFELFGFLIQLPYYRRC
jgi:hypothetical protein